MKRFFGKLEAGFDLLYLAAATVLAVVLFAVGPSSPQRILAGVMALTLAGGDAFHLVPRVQGILTGNEERLRGALGRGKQITSITMTVFYVLLLHIGLLAAPSPYAAALLCAMYALAAVRILLCLLPQNKWQDRCPPVRWGIWRNVPFALMGLLAAGWFFSVRGAIPGLGLAWLAIVLSFGFYAPVVVCANSHPKAGMLMLPKTCCYIWLLAMCLSL